MEIHLIFPSGTNENQSISRTSIYSYFKNGEQVLSCETKGLLSEVIHPQTLILKDGVTKFE